MKASIEFQLPEENDDFKMASQAAAFQSAVWEFDQWLRSISKHGDSLMIDVDVVRDRLRSELSDNGCSLL
jgi:hypothetical protein